ncbi:hypothetical protein BKK48_00535 [Rodentibacter heidelbergensis]|uniref:Cation efflux protein transmembrane domain-containing protein n=2 Tax=Rodentibacter heidelbergensis TaxID=1908258 RepID=A0A1V3ID85_9PAST|nr:hypothetical protein BKK48_00535 [Rodentibacter heidelbergensis]
MSIEFWGGYFIKSLPLIRDAGHMSIDSIGLLLSLVAIYIGDKKHKKLRASLILLNALFLFSSFFYILNESLWRFEKPYGFNLYAFLIAIASLLVNLFVAIFISRANREDPNLLASYYHVLGDMLGSVITLVALTSSFFKFGKWLDTSISLSVAFFILYGFKKLFILGMNEFRENSN